MRNVKRTSNQRFISILMVWICVAFTVSSQAQPEVKPVTKCTDDSVSKDKCIPDSISRLPVEGIDAGWSPSVIDISPDGNYLAIGYVRWSPAREVSAAAVAITSRSGKVSDWLECPSQSISHIGFGNDVVAVAFHGTRPPVSTESTGPPGQLQRYSGRGTPWRFRKREPLWKLDINHAPWEVSFDATRSRVVVPLPGGSIYGDEPVAMAVVNRERQLIPIKVPAGRLLRCAAFVGGSTIAATLDDGTCWLLPTGSGEPRYLKGGDEFWFDEIVSCDNGGHMVARVLINANESSAVRLVKLDTKTGAIVRETDDVPSNPFPGMGSRNGHRFWATGQRNVPDIHCRSLCVYNRDLELIAETYLPGGFSNPVLSPARHEAFIIASAEENVGAIFRWQYRPRPVEARRPDAEAVQRGAR